MATAPLSSAHDALPRAQPSGALTPRRVQPLSPAPLTGTGPLAAHSRAALPCERRPADSKFAARAPSPTRRTCRAAAVLRDISGGTSYQAVRLVFRPYTRVPHSICTSEPLGASTAVSAGFARPRHSSPPTGPHARRSAALAPPTGSPRSTRGKRALLGPCYKTGPTSRVARNFTAPRSSSRDTASLSAFRRI